MLPTALLRVSLRGNRVVPRYLGDDHLELAREVIDLFRGSIGLRLGDLLLRLRSLEGDDPRLLRGLAHVLRNNLRLEEVDTRTVSRLRLELFKEASRNHPVTPGVRLAIVERVGRRFGLSPSDVERLMLKVYDDERIIMGFTEISPEELIRRYNLSLAQSLLFKALDVAADIEATGTQAKLILRRVKLMGLMYVAEELERGIRITLDGPVSVLKQTDRYGTRLAKVLPLLVGTRRWRIRARVKLGRRIYQYEESSETSPPLAMDIDHEDSFDSAMELDFYRRLMGICSNVEREPEPLVVEGRLFIPDFRVGDVYIELVGFWTPQYLEKKYEKLARLRKPIVVMANEKLAIATWKQLPHYVVLYRDKPRITDIYRIIRPHCVGHNST